MIMIVIINGEQRDLPTEQPTVRDMVEWLGLGDNPVAVEVNSQVVPRRSHETHRLQSGDRIEVVTLVGGG
jgi:thiamine biosynthesis protein ThiS